MKTESFDAEDHREDSSERSGIQEKSPAKKTTVVNPSELIATPNPGYGLVSLNCSETSFTTPSVKGTLDSGNSEFFLV